VQRALSSLSRGLVDTYFGTGVVSGAVLTIAPENENPAAGGALTTSADAAAAGGALTTSDENPNDENGARRTCVCR
jgi:hypothetical protein